MSITVKELIEILKTYPDSMEVYSTDSVDSCESGQLYPISIVSSVIRDPEDYSSIFETSNKGIDKLLVEKELREIEEVINARLHEASLVQSDQDLSVIGKSKKMSSINESLSNLNKDKTQKEQQLKFLGSQTFEQWKVLVLI